MDFFNGTYSIRSVVSILLTLALLSSFGLHAIQIHHEHFASIQEHGGHDHSGEKHAFGFETLDIAMHLADKKLVLFLVASIVLLAPFLTERKRLQSLLLFALRSVKNSYERHGHQYRMHDYLSLYLRKGIFHSKAY